MSAEQESPDALRETGLEHVSFGASPLASALRRLLAASADTRSALAQRMGLSSTETWAVEHLMTEAMGPVELSRRLGITSAAATVLVRRLEKTGHVARAPHATDQRRIVLHPTASAQQAVQAALGPLLGGLEEAARGLSPEQQSTVAEYVERAAHVIETYTRPGDGQVGGPGPGQTAAAPAPDAQPAPPASAP